MRDGGRYGAGEIAGSAAHITAHQGGQQDKNKWAQAIMIARGCSLRVGGDVHEVIFVADDSEIEPPVAVYACLPEIFGAFVLLGAQRRMVQVRQKESCLLPERSLHRSRRLAETSIKPLGEN
jgi:hypothetical protein